MRAALFVERHPSFEQNFAAMELSQRLTLVSKVTGKTFMVPYKYYDNEKSCQSKKGSRNYGSSRRGVTDSVHVLSNLIKDMIYFSELMLNR